MNKSETGHGAKWRLDDLIAFECALARDDSKDWAVLKERDSGIAGEQGMQADGNRRRILRHWLGRCMEQDRVIRLTADSISQTLLLAGQVMCVAGFLSGMGAAAVALAYTGQAPVNVSAFFGVFILLQVLLAVVLMLAFALPGRLREFIVFGPLFRGLQWILQVAIDWAHSIVNRSLTGEQRQAGAELTGTARRVVAVHGVLSKWVAFGKIQATAIFFNLGALTALLSAVLFSDRAFGWQTTLQVSGETIHFMVGFIALPWSWFYGEGLGFPDLAQIQGSRIMLKDGIQALATQDLVSWWRFLALGIVFYGILPRLAFLALGKWQLHRALAGYDFRNAASEMVIQRLISPDSCFVTQQTRQGADDEVTEFQPVDSPIPGAGAVIRCLLSRDLAESIDMGALGQSLARLWRRHESLVKLEVFREDVEDALESSLELNEQVAILYESWIPPIKEDERQLRKLREAIPKNLLVRIVLLGIPNDAGSIPFASENSYIAPWEALVRRIGDPYLLLENKRL